MWNGRASLASDHADPLVQEAIHNPDQAANDYLMILDVDENYEPARRYFAKLCYSRGNHRQAARQYTTLIEDNPHEGELYYLRAQALAAANESAAALQDVSQSIHLNPGLAEAFLMRATLLMQAAPLQAIKDLSLVLLLDTGSRLTTDALLQRGVLYAQLSQHVSAAQVGCAANCNPLVDLESSHCRPLPLLASRRAALLTQGARSLLVDDQRILSNRLGLPAIPR